MMISAGDEDRPPELDIDLKGLVAATHGMLVMAASDGRLYCTVCAHAAWFANLIRHPKWCMVGQAIRDGQQELDERIRKAAAS